MTMRVPAIFALATAITFNSTVFAATPEREAAHMARDTYLAAINSNDLDAFLATVTDDIVFIAPNSPVMEGKSEVGPWVGGYFNAVETLWNKTSVEFVVAGNWAFERYTYTVVDTPHGGGESHTDSGNGINIYRLGGDGVWLVARDAWATDRPLTGSVKDIALTSCTGDAGPC